MSQHLSGRHRNTLHKILDHRGAGNVEWREVLSLLEAVGTVEETRHGKFKVTVGPETEVLERPREKDVDRQMLVDLRRMLAEAGYASEDGSPEPDERSRDYGDSRRGLPE
jgi:hypothetical protein